MVKPYAMLTKGNGFRGLGQEGSGVFRARWKVDFWGQRGAEALPFLYRLRGAEAPLFHGRAGGFDYGEAVVAVAGSRFLTSFGMTKFEERWRCENSLRSHT